MMVMKTTMLGDEAHVRERIGKYHAAGITDLMLHPVGVVKSDIKTPELKANANDIELQTQKEQLRENHQAIKNNICELVIFPKFESLLGGIEEFNIQISVACGNSNG